MKKVGIIMGSDSDLPIIEKAINTLKSFDVPFEVHVFSAHRTPEQARDFSLNARQNGFGAIIAAAGMAAHLAGAIAANTTLPVIGIPVKSGHLNGVDALLSTVQMPSGIPVATGSLALLITLDIIAIAKSPSLLSCSAEIGKMESFLVWMSADFVPLERPRPGTPLSANGAESLE